MAAKRSAALSFYARPDLKSRKDKIKLFVSRYHVRLIHSKGQNIFFPSLTPTALSNCPLKKQDKIPIHPSQFGLPPEQAIINELNKKYANRVLHDVGLCICVFDVAEVGEGKIRYGDGFLWYTGEFKCG